MANRIGWRFPSTNGGRLDGFNDPGMAHFTGDPLVSLARETIQNSLDAKSDADGPVHMEFGIEQIDRRESLGREELAAAIGACLRQVADSRDEDKAHKTLMEAQGLLQHRTLPYLRVADQNTTGLNDRHWKALVKMQGASVKEKPGAGGSHGIGKYAPFVVSPLRTVFYWTRCGGAERFQGKAVLMSHQGANGEAGETQGTGFFGHVDGCRELTAAAVPERIQRTEHGRGRGNGTSLWIAGFRTTGEWQPQIARSVVSNFFYAIEHEMLRVVIEPNQDMADRDLIEIDKSSIAAWFDYLFPADESNDENDDDTAEACLFWDIICTEEPAAETEDRDLGRCRLWIRVAEGLPAKVGFVRGNGMLITTQQRGLQRFPGLKDFIAVCVFDAVKGNELLRKMENPQHNQFEPDRLSDEGERDTGRAALKRITTWIRKEIRKRAAPPPAEQVANLSELAKFLPDLEAEDPIDHAPGGSERLFDEAAAVVRLRSQRPVGVAALPTEEEAAAAGDGEDSGDLGGGGEDESEGGGGTGAGSGEGDGIGGTGGRGGEQGRQAVPISDVRFVPVQGSDNRYRVSFTALGGGEVSLDFGEAGDSTAIERPDVTAFDKHGGVLDLTRFELVPGVRTEFEITAADAIGGRAWRIFAGRRS